MFRILQSAEEPALLSRRPLQTSRPSTNGLDFESRTTGLNAWTRSFRPEKKKLPIDDVEYLKRTTLVSENCLWSLAMQRAQLGIDLRCTSIPRLAMLRCVAHLSKLCLSLRTGVFNDDVPASDVARRAAGVRQQEGGRWLQSQRYSASHAVRAYVDPGCLHTESQGRAFPHNYRPQPVDTALPGRYDIVQSAADVDAGMRHDTQQVPDGQPDV